MVSGRSQKDLYMAGGKNMVVHSRAVGDHVGHKMPVAGVHMGRVDPGRGDLCRDLLSDHGAAL